MAGLIGLTAYICHPKDGKCESIDGKMDCACHRESGASKRAPSVKCWQLFMPSPGGHDQSRGLVYPDHLSIPVCQTVLLTQPAVLFVVSSSRVCTCHKGRRGRLKTKFLSKIYNTSSLTSPQSRSCHMQSTLHTSHIKLCATMFYIIELRLVTSADFVKPGKTSFTQSLFLNILRCC